MTHSILHCYLTQHCLQYFTRWRYEHRLATHFHRLVGVLSRDLQQSIPLVDIGVISSFCVKLKMTKMELEVCTRPRLYVAWLNFYCIHGIPLWLNLPAPLANTY